ncbi:MAG: hypothetical protein E3J50_03865 [Dehalococcoidia bacterium]|nr:MAG: hypothetical protein E3J50_03865 [Dehalococcoidia bacterium]
MVDEKLSDRDRVARKTKQERRERRREKKKAKLPQHGKSLARVYRDAVSKRARATKDDKQSS